MGALIPPTTVGYPETPERLQVPSDLTMDVAIWASTGWKEISHYLAKFADGEKATTEDRMRIVVLLREYPGNRAGLPVRRAGH